MRVLPAVVTASLLITSLSTPAQADPACLGLVGGSWVPDLADRDTSIPIWVAGATLAACPDLTLTVSKTDGSVPVTVALDQVQPEYPPAQPAGLRGAMPLRVRDGAGDWVVTSISDGTDSRPTDYRFTVRRATVATLDQPRTETGATPTTVTGSVRRYTSTGSLAPAAGAVVRLSRQLPPAPVVQIGTLRTDATGRFSARIPLTRSAHFDILVDLTREYGYGSVQYVTAYRLLGLYSLAAAPKVVLGEWWKVSGRALPGFQWTSLDYWNGTRWMPSGSIGASATVGTFTRYLRAPLRGALRVRVTIGNEPRYTGLVNTPFSRVLTVQVSQPPPRPTYLTGQVGPRLGGPVRTGTQMSTFGRLQLRRADGRLVPMYDERVEIQTWARGDAGWRTRSIGSTTATGYFHRYWDMPYPAGANVAVRVLFRAPYPTALPSARILGAVLVR